MRKLREGSDYGWLAANAEGRRLLDDMGLTEDLENAGIEVARLMLQIHPWAKMARFTRSGGEAMSVAVRP